ncbi:MAG: leucine-rich repeat domain-containing protein [Treponema sp.]|nr:leucine-rich repeat domain-containing protein [Treponema sp.]
MNKKTVVYLALVLLVSFITPAQQFDPEGDFRFERIDNGMAIRITGNNGNRAEITIPPSIQGLPVTSIGNSAFYRWSNITSITIPSSVTAIGRWAFRGCNNLTAIHVASDNPNYSSLNGILYDKERRTLIQYPGGRTEIFSIPNSVTAIGDSAFWDGNLTSITIPDSVTAIGEFAFRESGLTSVTMGNRVTSIGRLAFHGCTNLTSITIPDSVTSIGEEAFSSSGITSVTIPGSITSIGRGAFADTALTTINVSPNNPRYSSLDGILYDKERRILIAYPTRRSGSFTIPGSVTSIGAMAFWECSNLTSITIPNNVTSIGETAFYGCTGLTSITIPGSVASIGSRAFSGTHNNLSTVTFGGSNTRLGSDAFPFGFSAVYSNGGAGTYTRPSGGRWVKQ